jgi:hypothetical protein
MTFFSTYVEWTTGSLLPSTMLHTVILGLTITTLTPFTYALYFL